MATGRIRRSARRGIAAAMLGWLGITAAALLTAPSAGAAPSATVEIRNVTPPAASVDPGGSVTFVNKIPSVNRGGVTVAGVGGLSATVFTDVSVAFFGERRDLQFDGRTSWNFTAPATTGQVTYTYRVVPAAGTPAVVVDQLVSTVAAGMPALPAPTPYVVQTVAPNLPTLPSVNVPPLPSVSVPPLPLPLPGPAASAPTPPGSPPIEPPPSSGEQPAGTIVSGATGPGYTYGSISGVPQMAPSDVSAAAAFDPARFFVPGQDLGSADRAGSGSGGLPGGYDGAAVPVFGQLAGLDGSDLDDSATEEAAASSPAAQALPAAALAAVVALATVTAALVRTYQASRSSR